MKNIDSVKIRPQKIKDAKDFFRILTTGNFEFFPILVPSIEAEKRFLRASVDSFKARRQFNFAITLDEKVVGAVGIMPENGRPYNAEIGYFVEKEFHGRGIALKAAKLAEEYALKELPMINRLQAVIVVGNHQSVKVIEKAGYIREGILQGYLKVKDRFFDAYIYGKVLR